MDTNSKIKETSFWKFINTNKTEIPIIQRDYAQGRNGKEKLREKFLSDLKSALDSNKTLKLDFVYGSVENESFNPLDGQQRLTTLWLLHWYISFKAGKLSEYKDILKRFSYETRTSSREFCLHLSDFKVDENHQDSIVEAIQNQTWFLSIWKQDPTIQAMLNMLGGTPIKDERNNEIIDGIEEVFKSCDFMYYWEKLIGDNCSIVFYHLDLKGLSLTDDLYIKMNSRGKGLSSFENFKADFVGYIKRFKLDEDKKPTETIAHKLDTDWTNLFWANRSQKHKIDKIYFAFINRYILNSLITVKNDEANYLYSQEALSENKLFKYLSSYDPAKNYDGFDVYKNGFENEKWIERLEKTLDNFKNSNVRINDFFPEWSKKSDFLFIPKYKEDKDDEQTSLTQSQTAIFYAISCFFEINLKFHESSFMHWMRVVWNIVENANINTSESMIGTIRLIDELKLNSHNIYAFLADPNTKINSESSKAQLKEEIEKAKKIIDDPSWEVKIIETENHAFFNGAVRFLFRTDLTGYDWENFDNKFKNAKEYFDNNGVAKKYKENALLLKALVSRISNSWSEKHLWWHPQIFDNEKATWKSLLLDSNWSAIINEIMSGNISVNYDENHTEWHKKLYQTDLLVYVAKELKGSRIRNIHNQKAIYPPRITGVILDMSHRDQILSNLEQKGIIEISEKQKIKEAPSYRGWEIHFTANRINYQWWDSLKVQIDSEWNVVEKVDLNNLEVYLKNGSLN